MKSNPGDRNQSYIERRRSPRVIIEDLEPRTLMSAAPVAGPANLHAMFQAPASIQLSWTDSDKSDQGYFVLRSSGGSELAAVAMITNPKTTSFVNTTVVADTAYEYQIDSYANYMITGNSNTTTVTTPLAAPTGLTATAASSTAVQLAWTANSNVADYYILRSSGGSHFSQIAIVTAANAGSYTDSTAKANQSYTYEIEAANGHVSSPFSAHANVTTPNANNGNGVNNVTITTRFGDELVITAPGADDAIALTESGSKLTIDANGFDTTDTIPAAGVFVYTRGGDDEVVIGSSVSAFTTVDTIDGAPTSIQSSGADVSAWIDSTDNYAGTGDVHRVASFAGNVGKTLGASLANPSDSGSVTTTNLSLWGTGPVMADVNQGEVGDCYFLSTLAAFANTNPSTLHESAVDLGDGTYAVQFYNNGTPEYVRVNDQFPSGGFNGFDYAHPGSNDTIWAMVMEKAFAYFRSGANTYASISAGWMGEVYSDLNVSNTDLFPSSESASAFFSIATADLADGEPITLATSSSPPNLVGDHAYTLVSAYVSNGVDYYVVRNPWGSSGDSLENKNGYATLTFAQVQANFAEGCMAI